MTAATEIRAALSLFTKLHEADGDYVVTTQYLYPSNDFVSVHVLRATSGNFVVSDGGGALDVLSAHGIHIIEQQKAFSILNKQKGLKVESGHIKTARLPRNPDLIANAVVTVARASAQVAEHCLIEFRPPRRRDLEAAIFTTLQRHVSVSRISRHHRLPGESNRQYTFDFAIPMGRKGMLIVDAVEPEPASFLAKFASHMDVSRRKGLHVQQRIVYDDQEDWKAEDLSLLQMAANLVPLSKLRHEMKAIGA